MGPVGMSWRIALLAAGAAVVTSGLSACAATHAREYALTNLDSLPPDDRADTLLALFANPDTTRYPELGDEQRLAVGTRCPDSCRHGPRVRIIPLNSSNKLGDEDIQDEKEAPIALIVNLDSAPGDSYPKFNLQPRDQVLWIVGRAKRGPDGVLRGRSRFVSRTLLAAHKPGFSRDVAMAVTEHPERPWTLPLARFVWSDSDETAWGGCGAARCCK